MEIISPLAWFTRWVNVPFPFYRTSHIQLLFNRQDSCYSHHAKDHFVIILAVKVFVHSLQLISAYICPLDLWRSSSIPQNLTFCVWKTDWEKSGEMQSGDRHWQQIFQY